MTRSSLPWFRRLQRLRKSLTLRDETDAPLYRPTVAFSYLALVMLWSKNSIWVKAQELLKKVGKMAFTNYILTSVLCTLIFYGHGLGLFGTMDRLELLGVVIAVWIVLIILSDIVLKRYHQGPLERLWRRLTYLR